MEIRRLIIQDTKYIAELGALLADAFPHCYAKTGVKEVRRCLQSKKIALVAIADGEAIGLIGAMPNYEYAWEVHPLVVKKDYRGQGIGTKLCQALEEAARECGCYTLYLGSDDEFEMTTLANCDLFVDTYDKIAHIKNIRHHPYEFYQKNGYQIVGVIPDANGVGKPDIWLAKSIRKKV